MVVTILEAHIPEGRLKEVEPVFREGTATLPPEIKETFLVQDSNDQTLFRLITVWRSQEGLDRMRSSGEKPKGIQMFEAVGASPRLTINPVVLNRPGQ